MKKMIVAFAVVALAVVANAAACSWSTSGTIYKADGASISGTTYTAYLFDTATVSQADLVDALRNGGSIASYSAMSSYNGSAVKVPTTSFTQDSGKTITAYFAIVLDDSVYVSNTKSATTADVGTAGFAFGSQSTISGSVFDVTTAVSGAGWYATAGSPIDTPEPTSGMLLLIGLAGLALRRKQA